MKKVIYNALCFDKQKIKSPNSKIRGGLECYLKQCFVSLVSAKISNPDCDVMIVINQALPEEYSMFFSTNGIKIRIVPFDNYTVPSNFKWEYAFYKLKVLEYMVNKTDYDMLLGLDTDTYISDNLDKLWLECDYGYPILYPLAVTIDSPVRAQIIEDYKKLYGDYRPIIQYGGEFIAGTKSALLKLSKRINDIYIMVQKIDFEIDTASGDESLLSMAALELKVLSATPYIRRYWSRRAYYDVDSRWENIPIWHLPAEKNYGFYLIYNEIKRKNNLPSKNECGKIFNLPIQNKYNISMLKYYFYNVLKRYTGKK